MKTALIIAAVLIFVSVLAVGGLVVWLLWRTHAGTADAHRQLSQRIAPVESRLAAGQNPDAAELERFARDRETRRVLYDALEKRQMLHLFPTAYRTQEALAEADLVLWLAHPNELAAPPDEIELMAMVPLPGQSLPGLRYYVFRFRTKPPHWAAEDGWMAGVAGPFAAAGPPEASGAGTFSRFESYDSRTPEEHVRVTHGTDTHP
jgi:hypothetical protein